MVDVIEAFNSKTESDAHNQEAWRTAQAYGLPVAAGSDAHDPPGIGAAWVQMPDFDGPESFLSSLGRATIVGEYRPRMPSVSLPGQGRSSGWVAGQDFNCRAHGVRRIRWRKLTRVWRMATEMSASGTMPSTP